VCTLVVLFVGACSGATATPGGVDAGSSPPASDAGTSPASDAASSPDGGDSASGLPADGGSLASVVFSYEPQWKGVSAVTVIGGFGQPGDWTTAQPFLALASDGAGGFSGSAQLPPGQYSYVFEVTGDADAATPKTFKRYVIDPTNSAYAACPAASPTYSKVDANPCSVLTVPQAPAAPVFHVTGTVTYGGAPAAGYLVVLERDEAKSHHFAANRTNSAADGSFDFAMAQGQYRVQVQYPTFLSATDAQRDPTKLQAMRRQISSAVAVAGPVSLGAAEMTYDAYGALSPTDGGAALPTTFTLSVLPGASAARVAVYGPGNEIGDPWFASPYGKRTEEVFDGGFNTAQATQANVQPNTRYSWGTWQEFGAKADGGVVWSGESMVFPIAFP